MSMELLEGMMANNLPLTEERNARYVYHFFQQKFDHNYSYSVESGASVFPNLVEQLNSL